MIDLSPNKVTPLSKALAMLLFIALPFIGFWVGVQHVGGNSDSEPTESTKEKSSLLRETITSESSNNQKIDTYTPRFSINSDGELVLDNEIVVSGSNFFEIDTDDYRMIKVNGTNLKMSIQAMNFYPHDPVVGLESLRHATGHVMLDDGSWELVGSQMSCEDQSVDEYRVCTTIQNANGREDKMLSEVSRSAMELKGEAYIPIDNEVFKLYIYPDDSLYVGVGGENLDSLLDGSAEVMENLLNNLTLRSYN